MEIGPSADHTKGSSNQGHTYGSLQILLVHVLQQGQGCDFTPTCPWDEHCLCKQRVLETWALGDIAHFLVGWRAPGPLASSVSWTWRSGFLADWHDGQTFGTKSKEPSFFSSSTSFSICPLAGTSRLCSQWSPWAGTGALAHSFGGGRGC